MATTNTSDIKQYYVHTVGGEKVLVKASSLKVDEEKKQIVFSGGNSEWIFFLHGIAGIETKNKPDTITFGQLHWRTFRIKTLPDRLA
jgi:hypothetical protein